MIRMIDVKEALETTHCYKLDYCVLDSFDNYLNGTGFFLTREEAVAFATLVICEMKYVSSSIKRF